jgi:hypothetical protein
VNALDRRVKRFHKHVLKCNNLILKEIIVFNASYVCLHAFLLHRESPDLDPGRLTPHF